MISYDLYIFKQEKDSLSYSIFPLICKSLNKKRTFILQYTSFNLHIFKQEKERLSYSILPLLCISLNKKKIVYPTVFFLYFVYL